jgi:heat shock protein HslJ
MGDFIQIMKKVRRSTLLFTVACLSILFAALSAFGQRSEETSAAKWLLTHIDGKAITASKAYIEINNENTRFSGSTGCNRMFGGMELSGSKLTVKGTGTTRMACLDPEVSTIENNFLAELGRVNGLRQDGETLELLDGARVALKFMASKQESAAKLQDKKWFLEPIKGNAVELKGDPPFLSFDPSKQSAGGNTGCNVFGGSYAAEGSKLTIKDAFQTLRACEEDNRMSIEREFMDGLQNAK